VVESISREQHAAWWRAMLDRGVLFHPEPLQNWYVSAVHGDAEVKETLAAAGEALRVTTTS
jgi:glutamate-1-semialdehyde aminotransferase